MDNVLDKVSEAGMRRGVEIYSDWMVGVRDKFKEQADGAESTIEKRVWEGKFDTISHCIEYFDKAIFTAELSDQFSENI